VNFNEKLVQLIDAKLAADPFFKSNEISVNIGLDGDIMCCWSGEPGRLKLRRFERLVRQAREELAEQERRTAGADQPARNVKLGGTAPSGA